MRFSATNRAIRTDRATDADVPWMRRAIALARRGEGLTRPNPPVGAVVVKDGRVVGEGWHRKAGGPHAEVHALRQAGAAARGATIYVTLEPCSTWGRTPPCTEAVLAAGIVRVVAACADPNPKHAGRGLRLLRRQGLETRTGVCREEALELIEPFSAWIRTRRPWVTLKLASTLDGRIADAAGHSKWITGAAARTSVQALRRRADAIMVGVGTVNADDPCLLPRPARGRKPFRVVVDSSGRADPRAQVFTDEAAERTLRFSAPAGQRVPLAAVMKDLGKRGLLHVVCEGGGELAAGLLRAKLVDELRLYIAPKVIGGHGAVPSFAGAGWPLAAAPQFAVRTVERMGEDVLMILRPRRK